MTGSGLLLERSPLSLSLPTRSGLSGLEMARLARAAEEVDFDTVFVAERVADAFAVCQQILAETTTLRVGTAVLNARLRHPVLTAMTAMAMAEASGERFLLGLGTSNAHLNESLLGLGKVSPLAWMTEYVAVIRQTLSGDPIRFPGQYFQVDDLVLDRPRPIAVPVYLGALQSGMLRLAGAVADGAILNLRSVDAISTALAHLTSPAAQRDQALGDLHLACVVPCCVSDDIELAREAARHAVLDYMLHPSASQLFDAELESGHLELLQNAMLAGDREHASTMLPDPFVDSFVVSGSPAHCAEQLHRYRAAGVHMPVAFPRPVGSDWATPVWEMAEAYRNLEIGSTSGIHHAASKEPAAT
ncbi:MAG TPA: LLM class flavin-dependent oxidoreductase [Acidimicrobiales bacterium]|nr:LLM class flavin-dependent oxidoreductase [Acidimicrobiales bacterium]